MQEFTKSKMPQAKTAAHTSCEPAHSTCIWTCHKSHLMREFTRKMPHPKWIPRPRPTLCASLRSRNAHGHVTGGAILLCEKNTGKMLRPRWIPRPRPTLRASLRNAHGHVAGAILCENLQGQGNAAPQMDPQTATHTLREPAQLKCTWAKHKSHFVPECTGKKLEARFSTLSKHRPLPLP